MSATSTRNTPSRKSQFAKALAGLLDETQLFTRTEWARVLDVTPAAISQWVNDRTLPRADLLRQIVDIVKHSDGVPPAPLTTFEEMALVPASDVSPFAARVGASISDYMRRATTRTLGRSLRELPPSEQRAVLENGGWPAKVPVELPNPVEVLDTESVTRAAVPARDEETVEMELVPQFERMSAREGYRERLTCDSLLSESRVVIVGTPGSGKSTAIRMLLDTFRERDRSAALLLTASHVWAGGSGAVLARHCREALDRSCATLLIDGLDEVEIGRRRAAAEDIAEASRRYASLQMVVATRPIPELPVLQNFQCVSIAPLTSVQMIMTLQRSFHAFSRRRMEEDLELFLCHLTERESLHDNARNPLFLRTAASLFKRNAITPFCETELIGEYFRYLLGGWERKKAGLRVRKPWASPNRLLSDLAALCFNLVVADKREFYSADAVRWLDRPAERERAQQLPSLLSIMSGLFQQVGEDRWQVLQDNLICYLAAVHIVEGAGDVTEYLRLFSQRRALPIVLKMACGITSDAAPLLQYVAREQGQSEAERCILLFEALAQPILASSRALEDAYESALKWLDGVCAQWIVVPAAAEQATEGGALWELRATGQTAGRDGDRYIPRALKAIHRARSGPARQYLVKRMQNGCEVLSEFSSALEVEGRLHLEMVPGERTAALRAAVVGPQLT